jgi:glycosyltransferase involved in cell wall biosynthesis
MVPVDDSGALATALTSVLESVLGDQALAGRLRTAGYAVAARFTWSASAAEHQKIYESAGSEG